LPGLEGIELVGGIVPGSIVPVDLPQPDLVSLALVASAYHPRGEPLAFEFDMPELGSFTTDPVPVASQTTLRVSAVRALDPKMDTDTLFKKTEWRVRTRDTQGIRSPWVASAPPHRCDFMLAGGTRLPAPRRFVAGS
jgi:hypothetical protein